MRGPPIARVSSPRRSLRSPITFGSSDELAAEVAVLRHLDVFANARKEGAHSHDCMRETNIPLNHCHYRRCVRGIRGHSTKVKCIGFERTERRHLVNIALTAGCKRGVDDGLVEVRRYVTPGRRDSGRGRDPRRRRRRLSLAAKVGRPARGRMRLRDRAIYPGRDEER